MNALPLAGSSAPVPASEEEEEEETPALIGAISLRSGQSCADLQTGKQGVDLAVQLNEMRNQSQVGEKRVRKAAGRTCVHVNGLWADQGFDAAMKQVKIKAMSAAYFRLLERHPEIKEVFQLGNLVVWVTPSGCALIITDQGEEKMSDSAIDALFVAKK